MRKAAAIAMALLAAVFYAINLPIAKLLMQHIQPTSMAALLYLGAGVGVGGLLFFNKQGVSAQGASLAKEDLPYIIGMVVLDTAAPILLMLGISNSSASAAALLGNFETAATSIIAIFVFKEKVSKKLWAAIVLITTASVIISVDTAKGLHFSYGALLIILATICWSFENNCTRNISSKNTYEIVTIKGIFAGFAALIIAFIKRESMPQFRFVAAALLLGFVSYGLSIFFYIRAQNVLGAAKTSVFYATAPFFGAFLSYAILHETLSQTYIIALVIMLLGAALVAIDTLVSSHAHAHTHTLTHSHGGAVHTHIVAHTHVHSHILSDDAHEHIHDASQLEQEADKK